METLLVTCKAMAPAFEREAARVSGALDARSLSGWLARELGA